MLTVHRRNLILTVCRLHFLKGGIVLIFKKIFIAELQEINEIIETVKYADKLGMSSFDVGLSLLLDAAEIIIVICIVIGLFKEKKIKFTGRNTVIVVSLWLVSHLLCVVFNSGLPGVILGCVAVISTALIVSYRLYGLICKK